MFKDSKIAIGAFIVMLLIIIGCGGGGGGGNLGVAPYAGQYLEIMVNQTIIDPLDLTIGSSYQIHYVNYDSFGNRLELNASNWTLSGPGAASFAITQDGLITVNSQPAGLATVQATALVAGQQKTISMDVYVHSSLATTTLTGQIVSTDFVTGVPYLQVQLYDSNDVLVGAGLTLANGIFSVPTLSTAAKLTVKPSTIPDPFFRSLKYQGKDYATVGLTCLIPLPPLTPGVPNPMASQIFLPRLIDGPPPPPVGCN